MYLVHIKSKLVLIAFLMLISCSTVCAGLIQEIGIEVGPNYGFLDYDNPMEIWDPQWDWGFSGGILISILISDKFSFVTEIRYSNLNNKIELVNSNLKGNVSLEHNSISLPLLLRYKFNENMFFVDLGPEFALMISSKSHDEYYEPVAGHKNETEDISDGLNGYNISARTRIGFNAHCWNVPITLIVAYHHGLRGVAKEEEWWSNWKTREFRIGISYVYQFNK